MRVIGLTGGLASGKSTVGRMLRELGAEVVDADQVAREVVAPGQPALDEIARAFGPEFLASDGTLDRKRLAAHVFGDPARVRTLNAIVHPRVAEATRAHLAAMASRGLTEAVYEAPLIVENGLHRGLQGLIVVALDEERQVARAVARDDSTPEEARARLAAQLPLADKIAAADWVIDNGGSSDDTRRQVAAVWAEYPRRRSRALSSDAAGR